MIVGLAIALRPTWVIRLLSYGRKGSSDVNARVSLATRIIAGVSVIYAVGYLAWESF
jgi:hypothetical protein